jgi:hypothetical protein
LFGGGLADAAHDVGGGMGRRGRTMAVSRRPLSGSGLQTAFGLSLALQTAALVWFAMPRIQTLAKNLRGPFAEAPTVRNSAACFGDLSIDGPILEGCEGVEW